MTIKFIPNFITKDEANKIINFIDDNISIFNHNEERVRWMLRFGYDEELPQQARYSMSYVEPIKNDLKTIFIRTQEALEDPCYLTSWFLSKQAPGGRLKPHLDGAKGMNEHLEYTAMLYLNDLNNNGKISFPDVGFELNPSCGDLVIFNSLKDRHEVSEVKQNRYSIPMWFTKNINYQFNLDNDLH